MPTRSGLLKAFLFLVVLLPANAVPGQTPKPEPSGQRGSPALTQKQPATLADLPLPPEAILVLTERAADLLRALPRAVVLPPTKYQELLDEITRLKKQLQAQKPTAISKAELIGKVIGNRVEFKIRFAFVTESNAATVRLGCTQAHPSSLLLDGKTPLVWNSPDGLVVQVENQGTHELVLDLELAVTPRTVLPEPRTGTKEPRGESPTTTHDGFDLDLPQCAITTIALRLPPGIKDLRLNDQPYQQPLQFKEGELSGPLGRLTRFKVTWKRPQSLQGQSPVRTVEGRVVARLHPGHLTVEGEFTLKALGGPVQEWRLYVPAHAQVRCTSLADEARLSSPIQGNDGKSTTRIIRFKEPVNDPLSITLQMRQPLRGTMASLGPIAIEGANRHRGTIYLLTPADGRIRTRPPVRKGDPLPPIETSLRPITEEERRQYPGLALALNYWMVPLSDKTEEKNPWLEMELEPIQGVLATRLLHTLRLVPTTSEARLAWRVNTTLDTVPIRNGVEELNLLWPSPWIMDEQRGPRPVEWASAYRTVAEGKDTVTRFDLPRDSLKPFQLTLEAQARRPGTAIPNPAEVAASEPGSVILPLPRPVGTRDRSSHQITVVVPDDIDLSGPQPANPALELVSQEPHRLVWRAERMPTQVAVAWRPYRPEQTVVSTVDVHLEGTQARVRQRFQVTRSESPLKQVALRVPDAVADRVEILEGGTLGRGQRFLETGYRLLTVERTDGEATAFAFTLGYSFALPAGEHNGTGTSDFSVPLVIPDHASQGKAQVRIWSEPQFQVVLPGASPWQEVPLEIVAEEQRLPALVLHGVRYDLPLILRRQRATTLFSNPMTERALVQVRVQEGGVQRYRVRLLLRNGGPQTVDLAFPAPLGTLDLQILMEGKRLERWEGRDESGRLAGDSGRIARVRLPNLGTRKTGILEMVYQLLPGRTGGSSSLQTLFQPVQLPGVATGVPTCWQIELPPEWMPLSADSTPWCWGWRGIYLAPRPALTGRDVENWFLGEEEAARLDPEVAEAVPSFVSWRSSLATVQLTHVPQQAWLLLCSVVLLAVGLALSLVPGRSPDNPDSGRPFPKILLALLGVGLALLALLVPNLLATIAYGCEPGFAVLLLVLGVQWFLHERYRRRVVLLPGFSRMGSGSSLVQSRGSRTGSREEGRNGPRSSQTRKNANGEARPPEPSTVDAPPPAGTYPTA